MISDLLSEAAEEIRDYLGTGAYGEAGDLFRQRLEGLVREMDEIREILDTPPNEIN
jgi:hypothetical protein